MQITVNFKDIESKIFYQDLDKNTKEVGTTFNLKKQWYKLIFDCNRYSVKDIKIGDESIKHILNSGRNVGNNFEIWIHGDLSVLMTRVFDCIAQDDLLRWKDLSKKYLSTESWNESAAEFVPQHVKNFFSNGQGPYWWSYDDKINLPWVNLTKKIEIDRELLLKNLKDDLTYIDEKFYNTAKCISLKPTPKLPCVELSAIKNNILRKFIQDAGYKDVLQVQYVEMSKKSFIGLHRDDFQYSTGYHIIKGPTQLYFVLKGDTKKFKFKFDRAGLVDVTQPIVINNCLFNHSLFYSGDDTRGVLLIYGNR
jgi:hypothetical protein